MMDEITMETEDERNSRVMKRILFGIVVFCALFVRSFAMGDGNHIVLAAPWTPPFNSARAQCIKDIDSSLLGCMLAYKAKFNSTANLITTGRCEACETIAVKMASLARSQAEIDQRYSQFRAFQKMADDQKK